MRPLYLKQIAENSQANIDFGKDIFTGPAAYPLVGYTAIPWTTTFMTRTDRSRPMLTIKQASNNNIARDPMTFNNKTPAPNKDTGDIRVEKYPEKVRVSVKENILEKMVIPVEPAFEPLPISNNTWQQFHPEPIVSLRYPFLPPAALEDLSPETLWAYPIYIEGEPAVTIDPEHYDIPPDLGYAQDLKPLVIDRSNAKVPVIRKELAFGFLKIGDKKDPYVVVEDKEPTPGKRSARWFQPLERTEIDLTTEAYVAEKPQIALVNLGVPMPKNEKSVGPVKISWEGSEQGPADPVQKTTNDGDQNNSQAGR
jgi:hypothetical protein